MNDTTTGNRPKYLQRLYTVEGWAGLDSVGWRSGNQARSVVRLADTYALDRGADRVYVRRETAGPDWRTELVASWTPGRGWFDVTDEPLRAKLIAAELLDGDQ